MESKWRRVTLNQIGKIVTGKTPKTEDRQNFGEDFMFITPRDMNQQKYITSTERSLSQKGFESVLNSAVPRGSVLVSCIGSDMGKVVIPEFDCVTNQQINSLIVDKEHNEYVYYNLLGRKEEIKNSSSGSAVPILNKTDFGKIEIFLPTISEQKAIAHILGTLDDKIELNRKMNETLEEMAQALFKSWFVDFDPVLDKALAAGHEIPESLQANAEKRKALGNKRKALPQEIADLFPERFVFTEELGWVPEGWEVKSVTEAIQVNPRTSLKQGKIAKYADMKALPESGFSIEGVIEKEFKGGAKFIQKDILLARITPCLENGKTGLVDFLAKDEVGFGSTEFIVLREKGNIKSSFIACLSRNTDFRSRCIQSMVGSSGRQRVQNAVFDSMFLALPTNQEVLNWFNSLTDNYFYKITANSKAVASLSNLRDSLLPKLISGELKVPEVEKMQFE